MSLTTLVNIDWTIDIMSNTFTALDGITISEGPVHWSTSIGKLQLDTFQKTLLLWYILLWLTLRDIGLKFPQIAADVEFLRRKDCTFPPRSVFRSKQFVCVPGWSNGRHQTDNGPTYHRLNQGLSRGGGGGEVDGVMLHKGPSEGSLSQRRPLLGPSLGWKRLLPLSHLRHY